MNIPDLFKSGLFDHDVDFRDNFQKTPRRTPRKPKTKPNRAVNQDPAQITPVIPPPDDENTVIGNDPNITDPNQGFAFRLTINGEPVTNRPPLKIRIARLIAWAHLALGTIYASTLVYRFGSFTIGEQPGFPFILLPLVALVFIYIVVEAIVAAWCDTLNDILLGAVECWPKFLTLEKFFDQLRAEAASDIARSFFHQIGIPEVAAVIPHRPYIGSYGQSLIYVTTYFACSFYAPLSIIVKTVFWKVEIALGILYLAYLFTLSSVNQSQR